MHNSYYKGILYEFLSISVLFLKGYKILKWRYKTPVGEIDIITKRNNIIRLIEVKYRKNSDPYYCTSEKYNNRLIRAYHWWLKKEEKYSELDVRIEYMFWSKVIKVVHI